MHGFWRWLAEKWVLLLGFVLLAYLFVPIAVVMLLSFNQPASRNTTYVLDFATFDFTWHNWTDICGAAGICDSLMRSIYVGLSATLIATILGTLISFALVRYRFIGRGATNTLIFLPMATPEIVMGTSLLTLFIGLQIPMGFLTILIAHVMFCISFVVVTVKARLAGLDPRLQEAAMDLYATPWQAFRLVILPLVLPGIVAAALLAFSLSFDDFIITNFVTGTSDYTTFPMFIWGSNLRGIPPQVNAIATAMFLISFAFVIAGQLRTRRRSARRAATS
ncbi:ABC transporter permease [Catellatospora citrea]|uniref:ABC transporter permease n=1 Tax=Catellatospora citrea TaxID=53366 RepID=A0A8J3KJY9_9ACTN|nr:ABC transporter permease [Catellatospora citrea]RKE08034.1 ABC-type spermidine/putrescine transport system permease subunit II [Catellatospora citrea]GIF98415.1 ABC transporter permease [Catellatospora citrea]